jgi:hypothetical protein
MSATSKANGRHWLSGRSAPLLAVSLLAACSNTVQGDPSGAAGTGATTAGGTGGVSGSSGNGGVSGSGNSSGTGPVITCEANGTGAGTSITTQCADQAAITPGRSPLRRLTIPEFNNTVRDIIGETSNPAFLFPPEESGNGFGNDALRQSVPATLASNYNEVAEAMAARVTAPASFATFLPCSSGVTAANQEACARTFIESWVPTAYRRPLVQAEIDELVVLHNEVLAIADDDTAKMFPAHFASAIAGIIEAVLVSPEFLYKPEFGQPDAANPTVKRPTGTEMATRLSYFYWGTSPDAELARAAGAGELLTNDGVRAQATRLLNDPRARSMVSYFFDNLLPLNGLTDTPRDAALFPTFSSNIGSLMQQETRTFLEHEVFEPDGMGTWSGILTAPYTYVNGPLAAYYGMPPVAGDAFQKVNLDTTVRLGLLTQGAMMTGLTHSNHTNPVSRGGFIVNALMCRNVLLPTDPAILSMVVPPDPFSAPTGRERYSIHSQLAACAGCHSQMDPLGFALENFDAVGLYRATEEGVVIDSSGEVPDMTCGGFGDCASGIACPDPANSTPCSGASCAPELAKRLGANMEIMACFPSRWLDFAYGQSLRMDDPQDLCNREALATSFIASGSNIKQMLVDVSQTDGFLYLGSQE